MRQLQSEFQIQELHEQMPDFNVSFAFEVGNALTGIRNNLISSAQ
jgi:hypothetical protein